MIKQTVILLCVAFLFSCNGELDPLPPADAGRGDDVVIAPRDGGVIDTPDVFVEEDAGPSPVVCSAPTAAVECLSPSLGETELFSDADLEALQDVQCIDGDLRVMDSQLTHLTLPALEVVTGRLIIIRSNRLTSLSGLSALRRVGGLSVVDNAALVDLQGLDGITHADDIDIINNPALTAFSMKGLSVVTGDLFVLFHNALQSVSLPCVASLGGDLKVTNNSALFELSVDSLTDAENVLIDNHEALTELNLPSLTDVEEAFTLRDNRVLLHADGFENLSRVGGRMTIENNDSLESMGAMQLSLGALNFVGNDAIEYMYPMEVLSSPEAVSVSNNVSLLDADAFAQLESIDGNLTLVGNIRMTSLRLDSLTTIHGTLAIAGNNSLVNLDDFEPLTTLGHELYIAFNPELQNIEGLRNITSDVRNVGFEGNARLEEIRLPGITHIVDSLLLLRASARRVVLDIENVGNFLVTEMYELESIESSRLAEAANFTLMDNPSLNEISFDAFERVDGGFTITRNPELPQESVEIVVQNIESREGFGQEPFTQNNGS